MTHVMKVFAAFLLLTSIGARAESPDLTGEIWSVCGWDGRSTWHDTRLVFTNQSPAEDGHFLEGYFDWRGSRGSFGREYFQGTLHADGVLSLQGLHLQESLNIVVSRYRARLSDSGTALLEGVWLDGIPGMWAAIRDGGRGSAAKLCDAPNLSV